MGYLQLGRVLNAYNFGRRMQEGGYGVHQGGLAGGSLTSYEEIHAMFHGQGQVGRDLEGQTTEIHQLDDAQRVIHEFPYGEVTAVAGNIPAKDQVDTRAVGQACVYDGIAVGNRLAHLLRHLNDEGVQFLVVFENDV